LTFEAESDSTMVITRGRRVQTGSALAFILASVALGAQSPAPARTGIDALELTIDGIHAAFRAGTVTCRQLVDAYLARIDAYDKAGPALNAIQTINPRAREDAGRLDVAFAASGPAGALHCIPVLVKDQLDTRDMATTHGSAVFQDFVPREDATVVTKLRAAGAVIIGKATMGEFASGYYGSASGPIRNAYDPARNASGSSGGTGTGIAANFATVGIGEDTGGSIRGPAAVSNLVGLRPTLPLVSRHGLFPARPTTDTVGPITRTVRDAALVFGVIVGYDPKDPVTASAVGYAPAAYTSFLDADGLRGARIGVIRQPMDAKADMASDEYKKVRAVIDRAIGEIRARGAEIVDPVTIPDVIDRVQRAYDGNVLETEAAIDAYLAARPTAPARTLRDILLSGKVTPSRARTLMNTVGRTTTEPAYAAAMRTAEDTRRIVFTLMADHRLDALLYATFDYAPGRIAPDVMTRAVVEDVAGIGNNRRLSPVIGFPAIAVPAGFTSDGVPVGLELMARPFAEPTLFRLAYAYEQATRHRRPPASAPALAPAPSTASSR
jgi:Asp-tRNA(Asn)/Glu-tRNA(Gln) amidotransferase A subunit family amidase